MAQADQVPNDQYVKMPDGVVVGFPRDMPRDEIGALIEHKFPDQVKSARENTTDASGNIVPVNPMRASSPKSSKPLPADLPQQVMSGVNEGIASTLSFPNQVARSVESIGPTVVNALGGHAAMPPEGGYLPDPGKSYTDLSTSIGAIKPPSADPIDQFGRGAGQFMGGMLVPGIGLEGDSAQGIRTVGNALRHNAQAARDFNIPLTKGQTAGALPQLTKEEMLRQGGGPAQNIMRNFDATQQEAIGQAAQGVGSAVGANPESMRDLVTSSIQNKVAFHKDQASSLYNIAADGGVSIKPEMVDALPQVIDHSLENASVVVDSGSGSLTPGAALAKKIITEDTQKLTQGMADMAAQPGSVPGTGGITLQGIEQIRKKLVNIDGVNSTDARAVKAIKTAFDDWVQTSVDNMLVSGDPAALDALKQARSASKDYLSITNPHEGDIIGAQVKKLQSMDNGGATSEEVANYLYGANVVSPTLNAPKVAARIKEIVGSDSPAWQAVRADAWNRITKDLATDDPRSATMMAKRIETFLNDKGTSLSKVLYSDDERAQMQKLADALKATITPRDATNPSRTAYTIGNMVGNVSRMLAGVVTGGATGNPMIGLATTMSIPVFKNAGARKAALKAIDQSLPKAVNPAPALTLKGVNALSGALVGGASGMMESNRKPSMLRPAGASLH